MKTIAISLKTDTTSALNPDQKDLLERKTIDRRYKKAEAVKAHLKSTEYHVKRNFHQMTHAEFGKILNIAAATDTWHGDAKGESEAIVFLENNLAGMERVIVYGDQVIPFILKRAMLIGQENDIREEIYSPFGTATKVVINLRKAWACNNKEYSTTNLRELCVLLGETASDFPQDNIGEAKKILEIYNKMRGYLIS